MPCIEKAPITETELLNTVTEIFEIHGYRVFHVNDSRREVNAGGRRMLVGDAQTTGYPDMTIAGPSTDPEGTVIWAELKSRTGKLEPEQVEWLDQLTRHRAYVWIPDDLEIITRIAESGLHPEDGRTCWACRREEIIKRTGVRRGRTTPTSIKTPKTARPTRPAGRKEGNQKRWK